MGWQTFSVVQLFAGNTIISPSGMFVYSSAPGTGNLVTSIVPASGTDQFGNIYLAGTSTYTSTFATSLQSGFVAFYSGSLAAGWTLQSSIAGDVAGNLQVNATGTLELVGSAGMTLQGLAIPHHDNLQTIGAAPAAYSQTYEQAMATRMNGVVNTLLDTGIGAFP